MKNIPICCGKKQRCENDLNLEESTNVAQESETSQGSISIGAMVEEIAQKSVVQNDSSTKERLNKRVAKVHLMPKKDHPNRISPIRLTQSPKRAAYMGKVHKSRSRSTEKQQINRRRTKGKDRERMPATHVGGSTIDIFKASYPQENGTESLYHPTASTSNETKF